MVEVSKVATGQHPKTTILTHQKIQWQNWMQLLNQSQDDWQRQVDTMQKKNASMREALAKVWGVGEGHNPFKTEDEHSPDEKKKKVKIDTKTMTGKPITKVEVDPDMREVKVGKKNVR